MADARKTLVMRLLGFIVKIAAERLHGDMLIKFQDGIPMIINWNLKMKPDALPQPGEAAMKEYANGIDVEIAAIGE